MPSHFYHCNGSSVLYTCEVCVITTATILAKIDSHGHIATLIYMHQALSQFNIWHIKQFHSAAVWYYLPMCVECSYNAYQHPLTIIDKACSACHTHLH